ncbi:aminoglycoside phosphotransferase family protein [Rossellomorea aquimaris]|uniref:aminoglycoside phosphotransferase family protein n=1 Tax=Rossellomorea aquimaris TaxID=189382 RepID=UPI001CD6A0A1|nr:phosphotransferase [Rossellomorea aquimaris]MCA1054081.1 aminoglycoside phosphotransferase family protein [Rossellomorea aquimaris]
MTNLKHRLHEKNMTLLKKEIITGAHAGQICRITVLDENGREQRLIYKEFASSRNNEIFIFSKLHPILYPLSKVVDIWDTAPEAILMSDLKAPVKKDFNLLDNQAKKDLLSNILERLAALHTDDHNGSISDLPTHEMSSEWLEWCLDQLDRLCSEHQWADTSWAKTITNAYRKLNIEHYKTRCPHVITHGDPHLENIFYQNGQIWFIDWEWAASGSPLRDITILCQDLYDRDLIQFVRDSYRTIAKKHALSFSDKDYNQDFTYLYIDHTSMMLAWEIEKFLQGHTNEENIKKMIRFKVAEIERVANGKGDAI